jgi:L-alanine-DL-glutamate epimerase-like enolase superfamily enzyme
MKVAGMADAFGLDMSPHGQQQVHVHLDCAVPNATIAEFYPPQYDAKVYEAFKNPVVFNADGTVSPSQAPGAGLDINFDVMAPFRVK